MPKGHKQNLKIQETKRKKQKNNKQVWVSKNSMNSSIALYFNSWNIFKSYSCSYALLVLQKETFPDYQARIDFIFFFFSIVLEKNIACSRRFCRISCYIRSGTQSIYTVFKYNRNLELGVVVEKSKYFFTTLFQLHLATTTDCENTREGSSRTHLLTSFVSSCTIYTHAQPTPTQQW